MGKIVAAYCTSHILMSRATVEPAADRVVAGMIQIQQRLHAARPDLVVIVSNDHMFNVGTGLEPPFVIGASRVYRACGDLGIPPTLQFPGDPEFAQAFVAHAAGQGFDLALLRNYRPDHGVSIPAMIASPRGATPIVPLLTNVNMTPAPTPKRCYALGRALREFIEQARPADERIGLLGTGGLSHWLALPRHGEIARDFDEEVLQLFAGGRADALSERSADEIVQAGGNGGLEVINWLVLAGAMGGARGRRIYYEPIETWMTGMAGIEIDVAA